MNADISLIILFPVRNNIPSILLLEVSTSMFPIDTSNGDINWKISPNVGSFASLQIVVIRLSTPKMAEQEKMHKIIELLLNVIL